MKVKIHISPQGQKVVAVCDEDIFGKLFEQDDLQLDLSGDFYNGDVMSEEQTLDALKDAYILNIVGRVSIEFAKKNDLVDKIGTIAGIPHAQVFLKLDSVSGLSADMENSKTA